MFCTSCGAKLPVGVTTCPSCSTSTPYNIRTPSPGGHDAATVSSLNYIAQASSVPSSPGSPFSGTPQQNVSSINAAASLSQATASDPAAYQAAQPFPYPPPPTSPVHGRPPGGRSAIGFKTILLIIITLLVMASGLGLIYYSAVYHPAQLQAQATATAQVLQAQTTALANAQATGTAQANANATATTQAVATAQVVATTTALQNIYNQATSGPPAFSDPMNGSNTGNWEIGNGSLGGGCHFIGGAYHVTEPVKNYYLACLAQNTYFTNFAFQVKMTIVKGDEGGIIFRGNNASSKFYTFGVSHDGLFSLIITRSNTSNKPLIFGPSAAIKTNPGQANLLTVIARGSNIYLYINQQYVDSVHDTTYSAGEIGVYASDSKNSTDVAFNNVQVWKL